MGLPEFSIRRPVTTVMLVILAMLFGIIALLRLPQELFPPITYPQLTVFTEYANAAPEEIETLLTRPVEEAVGTVSGLKTLRSISKEGISIVMAEFDWDQNLDFTSLKMREKLDLIKARLPRDASEPLVVAFNPFERPILTISVTGNRNLAKLRQIATNIIKEELEKIDGVASASVEGGLEREILVEVNQEKLTAYGVSILEISDAISNANLNYPAGTIKESFYEYLIRTLGEFENVEEIGKVTVKSKSEEGDQRQLSFEEKLKERKISAKASVVTINDVADVKDTFKERTSFSRYNGNPNISIEIQKQAQANTMKVVGRVKKSFKHLREVLPKDIKMTIVDDQSIFIKDAINGVRDAAFLGGILAFFVLLAFLRNIKSAAIVTLSIPISVTIVFFCMAGFNISINMMSLGGLALGVGMLVDNAIVVIENIFRHQEMGESREKAATAGASEVANAIIASTLTTICVFFPMVFVVGIAGQLFKELAFTVIFSLIGSLWVALTLIPLLSCKLGGSEEEVAKGAAAFAGGEKWKKLVEKYDVLLRRFIRHKGIALTFVVVLFLGSLFVVNALEKELLPKVDQGAFDVKMDMPVGTKLMITNDAILRVEEIINKYPDVESVSSVAGSTSGKKAKDVVQKMGSHQAKSIVKLKEKTKVRTADLVQEIKERLKKEKILKDANIEFTLQQGAIAGAFGGGGKPITIEVKGERLDALEDMAREIEGNLEQIKGIFGIEDDIPKASPEVRINVDKDKASLYEISVVDLARIAQMVLRGYVSSQFKEKGREIDIRVRLRKVDRDTFGKLYHIRLAMPQGGMIPLGTVANFERGKGPSEIKRLGQERTITIAAGIVNRKLSDVVNDVEKMLDQTKVRPGYTIRLAGESEEMKKSFDSLRFALIFAIVLVYMVMAAQFESITQPLIILFTVPLSLIGVLLALFATSTSVSVVALLGVIILGGIVVNNGIVLVDYTNILISKGKTPLEAVVESGKARLRPIVMTALTTVLGLFPMALAVSRGGKLMAPMAISVMGGLIIATFFTPFVIPSIFILENDIRGSIVKFFKKETDKKNKQETNIQ